jgi:hypothetical protein
MSAERELEIRLKINKDSADAAARSSVRSARQIQDAFKQAGESQEQAAKRIADITDKYILKEYNDRVAYEARKQKLAEQSAQKAASDADRRAADLKAIEDKWLLREYNDRLDFEKKKEDLARRSAEAQAKAGQTEALDRQKEAFGRIRESAGGASNAIGSMASRAAALLSVGRIVRDVAHAFAEAEANALRAAKASFEFEKMNRERAALENKGMASDVTPAVGRVSTWPASWASSARSRRPTRGSGSWRPSGSP